MEKPVSPQNSPYIMDLKKGKYYWCACGKSARQPFCDGTHKGSSFSPLETVIEEDKKVAFCGCKQSKNPPYCDGSHAKL